MRILVTGNAGSGKSTVSERIASICGTKAIGLDQVVWRAGWKRTPKAIRIAQEIEIAAQSNWVVDGVSFVIQKKADIVVFLDFPRWRSYSRCTRRNLKYLFKSRPGLPENCPEILIAPTLVKIIWSFPNKVRPRLLALADSQTNNQRFEHVRSNADLEVLMEKLRAESRKQRRLPGKDGLCGPARRSC